MLALPMGKKIRSKGTELSPPINHKTPQSQTYSKIMLTCIVLNSIAMLEKSQTSLYIIRLSS